MPALSTAMREGSRAEHEDAEGSTFISELLEGRIAEEGYAAYLRRLRGVYAALETVVRERAGDPLVAAVHDPALERLTVIDTDLDHWAPGVPHDLEPGESPATEAYRARLHGATWGGDVVAHHYTRYLGDLSGGQAVGRVLSRTFDLRSSEGVRFFAFPEIPEVKPYKDCYRSRLDALPVDDAGRARMLEEVKVAFALNEALLADLQP